MRTNEIPADIQRLVDRIDSDFEVMKVPPLPMRGAKHAYCYENVKQKIAVSGGSAQLGWLVEIYPWFMAGVHHAVWQSPGGYLMDVTPRLPVAAKGWFIPDNRIDYTGGVIENVYVNLSKNRVVEDYFAVENFKNVLLALSPRMSAGVRAVSHPLWKKYKEFCEHISSFLVAGHTDASPCFCGSANAYLQCHGRQIRSSLDIDQQSVTDKVIRLEQIQ